MNNDNMMQMMMQMMMQQNQMMTMLMQQMSMQSQPSSPTSSASPTVTFESQGETQNVDAQIAAMKLEIENLKSQLAEAKEQITNEAQRANKAERELGMLKMDVRVVEKFYGKTLFEMAADAETVSGDDYYGDHKEEWDEQGLSNEEKHQKVKEFRDAAIAFADNALEGDMIEF